MSEELASRERAFAAVERERAEFERAMAVGGDRNEAMHAQAAFLHDRVAALHDEAATLHDRVAVRVFLCLRQFDHVDVEHAADSGQHDDARDRGANVFESEGAVLTVRELDQESQAGRVHEVQLREVDYDAVP
jgi:hypothetical protein